MMTGGSPSPPISSREGSARATETATHSAIAAHADLTAQVAS
jgi:hypothetical protein